MRSDGVRRACQARQPYSPFDSLGHGGELPVRKVRSEKIRDEKVRREKRRDEKVRREEMQVREKDSSAMGDGTVEYYDMAASDAAPGDSTTDEAPVDEAPVEQAGPPEGPPSWAAPLAGAVAGALGGAIGSAISVTLAPVTVLGGVAVTVAAGGALVTRALRQPEASSAESPAVPETPPNASELQPLGDGVDRSVPASPGNSVAGSEGYEAPSQSNPEGQPLQSYADGLLGERFLMERLRLLLRLHDKRDEAALQHFCTTEGFSWLGASSGAGCFLRQVGELREVFFLGSEADFQSRPEAFTTCWLHTNAQIQLQPLDVLICPEATIARGHVHTGFQTSYLSIADELLAALQESSGPVCLIGYSLGGALATLAAVHLCCSGFTQIDLITFGSPRVGNEVFRDCFTDRCVRPNYVRVARYVNTLDIVPHVPFNPEDVDSTRQGQLWRRVEEALTIPQQQLAGSSSLYGSYVHVVPGTVLDGLSSSVAGVVSRLANMAAESERLRMAAAVPLELVAEHGLNKYLSTLQEASKPAWLCLSNRLLAVTSPVHNALLQLRSREATMATMAMPSTASSSSWGIAMASAEATSSGIVAGLLLPQLLSSAVSAVGCYCVAQKVNQVSQHLQDHTAETARSNEELQLELQQLKLELSNLARGFIFF
eukprot:s1276_g9.t1